MVVQLEGMEKRKPQQLSGGQQQRVALARALVNRPAALLLDEPLGALDVKLRKQMQLELKRIQTRLGITFVYVTHDQEEALTMSRPDRGHEWRRHRADRRPEEIYEHPRDTVRRRLRGLFERLRPARRRGRGRDRGHARERAGTTRRPGRGGRRRLATSFASPSARNAFASSRRTAAHRWAGLRSRERWPSSSTWAG